MWTSDWLLQQGHPANIALAVQNLHTWAISEGVRERDIKNALSPSVCRCSNDLLRPLCIADNGDSVCWSLQMVCCSWHAVQMNDLLCWWSEYRWLCLVWRCLLCNKWMTCYVGGLNAGGCVWSDDVCYVTDEWLVMLVVWMQVVVFGLTMFAM